MASLRNSSLGFPSNSPTSDSATKPLQLNRISLGQVHILGQVDYKFITCVSRLPDGSTALVLVDQHAADERVRLEEILSEIGSAFLSSGADTRTLPNPVYVDLGREDALRFQDDVILRRVINNWGFRVNIRNINEQHGIEDHSTVSVEIDAVPASLYSKVCL
jgi:DNA mismatch repair protein MLH3